MSTGTPFPSGHGLLLARGAIWGIRHEPRFLASGTEQSATAPTSTNLFDLAIHVRQNSRRRLQPTQSGRYAGTVKPEELANLAHLRRARDLMDREYASPLDVAAIASAALMSTAHFSRQFRATYGETPYTYLMTRRIERSKALLRQGDLSVTDVCMAVGCTSLGSFSARFTEMVGQTPSAYRAGDHEALASVPGCIARDITRPSRKPSRIGEALPVSVA